mmetsp:Transcript_31104/g.68092  ORF Transcript_31104/g.68092 Transcript_31104/m.68092 type:complete len:108 (-) Transcript_31104:628-951(-)
MVWFDLMLAIAEMRMFVVVTKGIRLARFCWPIRRLCMPWNRGQAKRGALPAVGVAPQVGWRRREGFLPLAFGTAQRPAQRCLFSAGGFDLAPGGSQFEPKRVHLFGA